MSIRRRLIHGYALVLGLALAGTTTGLVVGNHYHKRAYALYASAISEHELLNELQVLILYNRPAKQLSPYLSDSARFREESQKLLDRVSTIEDLLQRYQAMHEVSDHHSFIEDAESADTPTIDLPHQSLSVPNDQDFHEVLNRYEITLERFHDHTESVMQEIQSLIGIPEERETAENLLLTFVQSPEFAAFIDFPDKLAAFTTQISAREQSAKKALQRAEALRTEIILGSLFMSAAIATLVAFYTSRAISRPIVAVTDVACRVTDDEDFDLRAPVYTEDEVGILAKSLNELIRRVKELLGQLGQKNADLETAFDRLKRQQVELVHSEKMSSLGQLVAGVAHEINNPVNFIHGNLVHVKEYINELMEVIEQIQQRYPNVIAEIEAFDADLDFEFIQEDLAKVLESMQVGTDRIRTIVLSLRNFSRLDEADYKCVDINEGIESSLMILQHRLKAKHNRPVITVNRDYGQLPPVECYPGQLNQVIMNILANAIDAIEERFAKATENQAQVPLTVTVRTSRIAEDEIEIAIADTGIGMTQDVREKIFDSFFTTKPEGIGTGIGMSISYQIITETHHGKIDFTSTPGVGTEFLICIPIRQPIENACDAPFNCDGVCLVKEGLEF